MEIEKVWKVIFDPDEAYVRQLQDLTMLYRTTRDKDKPDAIEATAPGLGNCLDDYLRDQGLPVYPRINKKGMCLCATVAQNAAELRREIICLKTKTPDSQKGRYSHGSAGP